MKTYNNLYEILCSYKNLELAYQKARKHKTLKPYIIEFEKDLKNNLNLLRTELLLHSYTPKPLISFIIKDPKTRKISKSDFRDRIVHHALCNIIEPIFEKSFIYDSYANRIGKGTINAIKRFDYFKRKASKNNTADCFVLKADIKKYFNTVRHDVLLRIIKKKITDNRIIWLIQKILSNYSLDKEHQGIAMPLGNLTSQFFANVYLNELDQFIKHELRIKCYIRYVDDFVIFDNNPNSLEEHKWEINRFLNEELFLELHPEKSKILRLNSSFSFLGFRIFYYHKCLKKSNIRKMKTKLQHLIQEYDKKEVDYDTIYDFLEGWTAYAKNANTYNLRKKIMAEVSKKFCGEISTKEINRHMN